MDPSKLEGRRSAVSAFAARQKTQNNVTIQESSASETVQPPPKSPRKSKRKVPAGKDETSLPVSVASRSGPSIPASATIPASPHPENRAFRPTDQSYQQMADGSEKLRAAEGKRIVVLGSYGLQVSEGEITLGGAVLTATTSKTRHWVHAPHCYALPVIRAVENSVIGLHPHPGARGLRQLSRLNPAFKKLWNEDNPEEVLSNADKAAPTFKILFTPQDGPKGATIRELKVPAEWNKKLDALVAATKKTTQVIFICGPKSSGKSTFGRLLANRLVTDHGGFKKKPWSTVSVLDLDPGQPEYGPPGVISLNNISGPVLSPPFCHPSDDSPSQTQLRAHSIAAVTPSQDPAHFIECALDLFSHYRQQNTSTELSLVINTPGWIQGTGLDILTGLIKGMCPTEVIYMSEEGPEETVDRLQAVCSSPHTTFTTLPSQPSDNAPRTPKDLRALQAMSYFHLASSPESQYQTWNPARLSEMRPWQVRYTGSERGFVAILCYHYQPALFLVKDFIDGMILALVEIESDAAFRDLLGSPPSVENITRTEEEGIPLIRNPLGRTLDPKHSRALGLVLVRCVDTARGELQLLTPIRMTEVVDGRGEGQGEGQGGGQGEGTVARKLVLVAGKFDTPTWSYAEDLYANATAAEGEDNDGAKGPLSQENSAPSQSTPWVEIHHGSQKRSVGSRWRVRRDLGRK